MKKCTTILRPVVVVVTTWLTSVITASNRDYLVSWGRGGGGGREGRKSTSYNGLIRGGSA